MTVNQSDVMRVTAEMSNGPDALQTVMHFRRLSAGSATDAQTLLDMAALMDAMYTGLVAHMADTITFDQVRVQNITQDILLGSAAWPFITVGTSIGEQLPLPTAALITYPTAVPKTRGGTYFGGFTELANTVAGRPSATLLSALATIAALELATQAAGGTTYNYVLVNREFDTVIGLVSSVIPSEWRTQRRRRRGVGA